MSKTERISKYTYVMIVFLALIAIAQSALLGIYIYFFVIEYEESFKTLLKNHDFMRPITLFSLTMLALLNDGKSLKSKIGAGLIIPSLTILVAFPVLDKLASLEHPSVFFRDKSNVVLLLICVFALLTAFYSIINASWCFDIKEENTKNSKKDTSTFDISLQSN
ncbi:hypothetical protein MHBO_000223 [Bonamia ostreae]|uniref:Uncharacterized protein n=1 Tax=Bonamia ostreae TaxID=126728 RepID=A0ABV2AEW4_9EUKA